MLKKQYIFVILILTITTSCEYTKRLEAPDYSTVKSKIVEIFNLKSAPLKTENIKKEEVEPDFNDEKLAYIYKHRKNLHVCEETGLRRDVIGKSSKVHQVNSQTYILQVYCGNGAYTDYFEYMLYSIKNDTIEIKPLSFLMRADAYSMVDLNGQPIWFYRKLVNGLSDFDLENLTLKVNAVHNLEGYKAEYKFENDEFKLAKYTVYYHKAPDDPVNQIKSTRESKVIYP